MTACVRSATRARRLFVPSAKTDDALVSTAGATTMVRIENGSASIIGKESSQDHNLVAGQIEFHGAGSIAITAPHIVHYLKAPLATTRPGPSSASTPFQTLREGLCASF